MNSICAANHKIRFRRFLRKNYAVFCSLHREISIGRLSVDTNNCSLKTLKKKIVEIFFENNEKDSEKQEFFELIKIENIIFTPALQSVFATSKENCFHAENTEFLRKERRVFFTLRSLRFLYISNFRFQIGRTNFEI